jgi:hypothetical protein
MIAAMMPEKRIRVSCPCCNKVGTISVDQDVVNDGMLDRQDSMLTLHVFKDDICEHEFTIVIDAHYKVRSSVGSN